MNRTGKYNRKWLRLAKVFYPLFSLICFLFPFLPVYILRRSLANVKGISVSVGKIKLLPFAFKMTIESLQIKEQADINDAQVYLSAAIVELDVDASKLWQGELCGCLSTVDLGVGVLKDTFANVKVEAGNPLLRLDLGMDITLSRLDIMNGHIQYTDRSGPVPVSIRADQININARELSTISGRQTDSNINIHARIYEGAIRASLTVDLLSHTPDFVLNASLDGVNMVQLNDFFQRYGRFDVSSGMMTMHSEVKAMAGRFGGYVESTIDNLHILGPEDKNDNILRYLWEGLVGLMLDTLKDHRTDALKTRINFEKPFNNPDVHVGKAIGEVVANAFVNGLSPYLRNEVKISL